MEAHEIAERIHEDAEPAAPAHGAPSHDRFRRMTGIYVGFIAMLLAVATLGGANATKETLNANIHASDTYSFYQAKYIRQTHYQTAAEQLELLVAGSPTLPADKQEKAAELIKTYRARAARYESEPETGEGKKELMARAKQWEARRDRAAEQVHNFEYAEALFQIAIVLGSVSIVAASPALLGASGLLAVIGLLLTANGYFLITPAIMPSAHG